MTEVRAEITANVWKVAVQVGQAVEVGDTLAVLESMKMEIPVESPAGGTVTEVRVAPEDRVADGDVLFVVS
jgi:acetyl-CoA carboxylase biotin carboxyl carrier protein